MLRKILFVALLFCFVGGLGYSYIHFKRKKQPVSEAIIAIPSSAAFIIESKNILNTWQKLTESNIIWSELQAIDYFSEIHSTGMLIDSLRKNNIAFDELIKKQSLFVSAHMSGANTFHFLYSFSIPNTVSEEEVFDFIKSNFNVKNNTSKIYDDVMIYGTEINFKKINYAFYQGIFITSKSSILIEEAIRQLNSGTSLLEVNDFKKVIHTAGKNLDANFYINYKVLPNILKTYFKSENSEIIQSLSDLANWTEIDLSLKPNSISLDGYTYSSDSVNNYMNIFIDQKPQKLEIIDLLPSNTALIIRLGISDFSKFQKRYKTYLEKNNKLFEFGTRLKLIEKSYHFDAQGSFFSWIDNEIALAVTEPKTLNTEQQSFAIFKSNNIENTISKLNELTKSAGLISEKSLDSVIYQGFTIQKINIPQLLPTLFNSLFNPITENYYTIIDDYVVFGNTTQGLRELINNVTNKNTLKKDPNFNTFYNNIETESNLFVFSNISRSMMLYKAFLNDEFGHHIDKNKDLLRKFDGMAIQISKDKNNMYYNNIYLHYNHVYKQETASLWEVQLDTIIHSKPQIVVNHITGAKDILVQDESNTIYLISNTGKIYWKKKIEGKIMGSVTQIDLYKNNKLQLIFNTKENIYLLDRNGKKVEKFPVKLRYDATAPITVLDYDKNKNYRILVPCENNTILNFEGNGNLVKGWEFNKSIKTINVPFKHAQINKKDYIIGVDVEGNTYILDRKGEDRIKLKNKFNSCSYFDFSTKKDVLNSFIVNFDNESNVNKLYLNDSLEKINIDQIKQPAYFNYTGIDNDNMKDYIFLTENTLVSFSESLEKLMELKFENELKSNPQIFILGENNVKIGVTLNNNEIHLLDSKGINQKGFPLFGTTSFSIGDINKDDTYELIVGGNNGFIYTYTLEK